MIIGYGIGFFGQAWPVDILIYLMTCTICWNSENPLNYTLLISGIYYPNKVKTNLSLDNQQVTNRFKFLVGTSETTRTLSSKSSNENS
jgi:hypothetical protein